ncbi:hypothetical protein [Rhizobium leguminosarum]|uniref:hypothetical protein n=1 Tax=Rhizobium leguminosarum TaxID=384 RepID=UPI00103156B6|nr:hypothetical protein [Rhizobium leguminosarum]TBF40456.1 hypothetical protein ELG92_10465 [Rhizobium leguminosarum]
MRRVAIAVMAVLVFYGIGICAPIETNYYGARNCPSPLRQVKVVLTTEPWLNNAKGKITVSWFRGSETANEWEATFHVSKTPGIDDSKLVFDETRKGKAPQDFRITVKTGMPAVAMGICDEEGIKLGKNPNPDPNYWPSAKISEERGLVMATGGEPCTVDGSPRTPMKLELTGATNNFIWRKICGPSTMHSMGFNMEMLGGMYSGLVTFSVNGSQCVIHVGDGQRDLATLFLYLDGEYGCDYKNDKGQCSGTSQVGVGDATNGSPLKPFFDALSIGGSTGSRLSVASQVAWDDEKCRWQGTEVTVNGKTIR